MIKLAPLILAFTIATPMFHPPYNDWRDLIEPIPFEKEEESYPDTSDWNELNVTVSAYYPSEAITALCAAE